VDSHAHIWQPEMPYAASAWTRPSYVYTAEQFLADMESTGVRYGVVAAASLFGTYNDYTIRSLRK